MVLYQTDDQADTIFFIFCLRLFPTRLYKISGRSGNNSFVGSFRIRVYTVSSICRDLHSLHKINFCIDMFIVTYPKSGTASAYRFDNEPTEDFIEF